MHYLIPLLQKNACFLLKSSTDFAFLTDPDNSMKLLLDTALICKKCILTE